uniref:Uncharacterized protein n=1 Tax=Oryza nivara TaxID=4536 RepID=A0A0E0HVL6_ORYNI
MSVWRSTSMSPTLVTMRTDISGGVPLPPAAGARRIADEMTHYHEFININMNVGNARMTYIVKRRKYSGEEN